MTQCVGQAQLGGMGCGCAWNDASIYNCHSLCRGYSVLIASLKRWRYQTAHEQWSPQQPVSSPVPLRVNFKKVVYSETVLQRGSPCRVPADEERPVLSAGAEIDAVWDRATDVCRRSTMAWNFKPAALTTANYWGGHADTFDDIHELHLRPVYRN